ncbi:FecR family protein [Sphingomonas sp. MMS12-HWE2-04]|uniref:FecR family protein n=1 Tax=Sphingomonas sp. MMS12-HWE2-04 TaxID=3234199 RepID=UPI00384FF67D
MTQPITRAHLATLSPSDAAALWQVHRDRGLPVEAGLFEAWLAESDDNRAAWEAVERVWALFGDADDQEFAALRQAALSDRGASRWHAMRLHWRPVAAGVALIALIAGGLGFGLTSSQRLHQIAGKRDPGLEGGLAFAAPANSPRNLVLADGTSLTLSPATQVRVALASDRRQVALERGSVRLQVGRDTRPLSVRARDRTIYDIGTRFEVALEEGGIRVALFEGSVRVEGGAAAAILRPGEQLVTRTGKQDRIVRLASAAGGQAELLQFDDVTLAVAAATVSEGSAVKLVITDPAIEMLRVSGRFRASDPERFAHTAAELLSLRVVRVNPTRIELRRRR